ncbi:MAG: LTA synthase family protein [Calditrichia bacterium]
MLLFFLGRLILLLGNRAYFAEVPFSTILKAFWVGARFDNAVTGYFLAPLVLLSFIAYFLNAQQFGRRFAILYSTGIFALLAITCLAEVEFFSYFHSRLNIFFVDWEENPGFILTMVWESYPVVRYLLIAAVLTTLFYLGVKKYAFPAAPGVETSLPLKIALFLITAPLVFVAIRGTLSYKTPLRWGHAYFSTHVPANQLALNGLFNLANDVVAQQKSAGNPRRFFGIDDEKEAYRIVADWLTRDDSRALNFPAREYDFAAREAAPPNIVLILLESFSQAGLEKLREQGIPLYFDELRKKGLYFPNFYSNGYHTYMGLFSSVFGMPNLFGKSIMKSNLGQQRFNGLPNLLAPIGYTGWFGVPHDPNFDNMAGFLKGNGVEKVISQFDFNASEVLSALGVPDHRLFEEMNKRFSLSPSPFLGIMLSSNNHGPWIIPEVKNKRFVSTLHYTDWALYYFLQLAEKEPYFKNTIFLITGDHGKAYDAGHAYNLQNTHIPLLIYAPGRIQPGVVKTVCGQADLLPVILSFVKGRFVTTALGRNVLNLPESEEGFACMQEGNTLAMRLGDWYVIDRIGGDLQLFDLAGEDPLRDVSREFPETGRRLKQFLRAYSFVANDMFLKRKATPEAWIP